MLKNKFTKQFQLMEKENATPEELEEFGAGALERAAIGGDIQSGTIMAGQISSLICDIKPCKNVIEDIISEAEEVRNRLINM